jgi:DNA polymerase-1
MPIQGTSADLMKLAMGELGERLDRLRDDYGIESWPINTIYDSLMVECDEDDGETVDAVMADVMDNVMVDQQTGRSLSRVPIRSDGKLLKRWTKE